MSISKKIGIIGGAALLVFSAAAVFAQGRGLNSHQPRGLYAERSASTTREEVNASSAEERVQALREQAQNRAAKMRQKSEERLSKIEDKAKRQLASHIADQLSHINQVWTDHFAQLLDRYGAILQKVQDRANIAASNGKNIDAVNVAIQSAKTAISTARTAVEAQAAKTYNLNATTTTVTVATTTPNGRDQLMRALRSEFRTLRDELFKDLFALRDGQMKSARQAVQNAVQTLGQIPGVDEGEATSTENR